MLFDLTRYSPADFKHEIRQLLALAIPMMLGQIATVAIGVVDTAMSGAAGSPSATMPRYRANMVLMCALMSR